jgi:hypothetical protein
MTLYIKQCTYQFANDKINIVHELLCTAIFILKDSFIFFVAKTGWGDASSLPYPPLREKVSDYYPIIVALLLGIMRN